VRDTAEGISDDELRALAGEDAPDSDLGSDTADLGMDDLDESGDEL
jgi:hypothetical protein